MSDVDLFGAFIPALALWMFAALAGTALVRRLLAAAGFYRIVWHPPLFDLALYVLILGCVVALANRILR